MLSLIFIDVQYSQKAVFSFEKGSNRQNHSSGSPSKIPDTSTGEIYPPPSTPVTAIWKTLSIKSGNKV